MKTLENLKETYKGSKNSKAYKMVTIDELEEIIRDLKSELKVVDDDWVRTLDTSRMKEMGITFSIRESRIILSILERAFENER
jgi:hypothetical protein